MVIAPRFGNFVRDFTEGKAAFLKDGRYGFVNTRGEIVVAPQYDSVSGYYDGLALVSKGRQKSYIRHDGEEAFENTYGVATPFQEGRARVAVEKDGQTKWGYIDPRGELVIACQYDGAPWFYNGLAEVTLGANSFYINRDGQRLFQVPSGLNSGRFSEGLASFWTEEQTAGFLDRTGKVVIGPNDDWTIAGEFSAGLAWVLTRDESYGFINNQGDYVIPPKFRDVSDFHDGIAAAALPDGLWGYINKRGEFVIEPKFGYARELREGLGYVRLGGKWGYVDASGEFVWPPSR